MTGLPSGAVTFLFTDIEGSTRLVKALRERYPQVLAEHRRLVRAAVAGQAGHEVDTQGDAFFVAFAAAKQAVLCALEVQRALARHAWPAGAPVRVRIGVHTGQAMPAGEGYTGLAVHRAARICAAARGGQVLVSQATQSIIEDEEEDLGFTLVDVGEHRLKDLSRPVRLFQLAAPGLDDPGGLTAGPVASLAAVATVSAPDPVAPVPRELPADVGAFTGRAVELAELDLLLPGAAGEEESGRAGPVVISAVSGTAGVGKSALAVRWAHRAAEVFPDGQLYVNLRGYDPSQPVTPGEALAGFLRGLGVPDQGIALAEAERAAQYRSLVARRRLLVVLDNAATEEQVRPLLPGSPSVMVVVTSRDSLAGLVARDGARRLDLDLLPEGEAVALLQALIGERASADLAATAALAGLCARLPLALRVAAELAASRPEAPLAELAAELAGEEDRLALLEAGGDPRSAVAGVFSWSYRHLPAGAARMFRLLGLHPAQDWDQYAAAALTATETLPPARRLLGVLARAHLIQPTGADRYQMHDLLRAYAARQAIAHDTQTARQAALTRLFDYYLAASAAAVDHLGPIQFTARPDPPSVSTPVPQFPGQAAAVAWLDTERATLLAVAVHATSHGWPAHSTRLAATIHGYLFEEHDADGLTVHGLALEAARAMGDRAAEARALAGLGNSHFNQGRLDQSADMCRQALALAREVGDRITQANALLNLCVINETQGRAQPALDLGWQAIALYRDLGDRAGEAAQLATQGRIYFFQGQWQEGIDLIQQGLRQGREIDDQWTLGWSLVYLAETHNILGRYRQAAGHAREALAVARRSSLRNQQARALMMLAAIGHRQGGYAQAAGYSQQALAISRELGDRGAEADVLTVVGETLLATGHPEKARACYTTALATARRLGMTVFGDRVGDDLARSDGNGCRARVPLPVARGTGHGLAGVPA